MDSATITADVWRAAHRPAGPPDLKCAARDLTASIMAQPWGQLSPSVYETGRLITLAPWLRHHRARLSFLVDSQAPDGRWGGPDGYSLVPALSATEALLTTLRRADDGLRVGRAKLTAAVNRGLRHLFDTLARRGPTVIPDTPAVELIVPTLVQAVNEHLDQLQTEHLVGLGRWRGHARLVCPAGMDGAAAMAVRSAIVGAGPVPEKLLHSLEIAGYAARHARSVHPTAVGTVGASPAATAAWLGRSRRGRSTVAVRYLEEVVDRYGGPVPSVIPITVFERAWVVAELADTGLRGYGRAALVRSIEESIGEHGTAGGVGLPPDADTTSVALLALMQSGRKARIESLLGFGSETHFRTWSDERTPSTTTNAHVLDAVGAAGSRSATVRKALASARTAIVAWLSEQQRPDGSWADKWHASPYYATYACTVALARHGGEGSHAVIRRAVTWLLNTQHDDGSWGHWQSTSEETAYAVRALLQATSGPRVTRAVRRGRDYLVQRLDLAHDVARDDPPLWHDKDLYRPTAVVRAAVLGAICQAQRHAERQTGDVVIPRQRRAPRTM